MHSLRFDGSFATWRQAARRALLQGLAPDQLQWLDEEGRGEGFSLQKGGVASE